MYSDFREAKDEDTLKRALKQYDLSKGVIQKASNSREITREITSMIQEALKGLKKQMEDSQKAVVAALQVQDGRFERKQTYQRNVSPGRDTYRPRSPGCGQQGESNGHLFRQNYQSNARGSYFDGPNRRSPSPAKHVAFNREY